MQAHYDHVSRAVCCECRDDEFDLDPENIMLMEAIWLSFQVRKQLIFYMFDVSNFDDDVAAAMSVTLTMLIFFSIVVPRNQLT